MIKTNAFLMSKKMIAPDVYHLYFHIEGDGFGFSAGQYVILSVPGSPSPLKRLYSFAGSSDNKNMFELLIKIVPGGAASEYIQKLKMGDVVEVAGPAGLFKLQNTQKRKIYMVTGTGYAPIRSFLMSNLPHARNSVLFWGLRDLSETYLFDELLRVKEATPSFSFYYCLSRQPTFDTIPANLLHYFRKGHIDAVCTSQIPTIDSNDEYYLCGSRTIIESLRLLLLSKGVQKDNLLFEKY